ncbi:MAG: hypothetical protein JWQ40_4898 [Segetibacter sp.]|nr:hypothetical protein [Segetibacter sp.]
MKVQIDSVDSFCSPRYHYTIFVPYNCIYKGGSY